MGPVYRTLASYEPLIYIALAIGGLFAFRRMWRSWREWRDSVYGLERKFAMRRLVQAPAAAFLILGLIFVEEIMITFPEPGDTVGGTIEIAGTASVPNFGFYKYEVARLGTQNWATISAGRDPKVNEALGSWNTSSLTNGEYFLRLVITDNVGVSLEPCVIAVRVLNE